MSLLDGIIKLSPPLPWTGAGTAGFVIGISRESLILSCSSATPLLLETLCLATSNGQYLSLKGDLKPSQDGFTFTPIQAEQERLADLRSQLRKLQHISICQLQDVEASDRFTGFERFHFTPQALPELDSSELESSQELWGRRFALPLLITGMTGGVSQGALINRRLAAAASAFDIPMGVGSQRLALENPEHANIFAVKRDFPNIFLIGNIGATQLLAPQRVEMCQRAIEMIEADALAIHVNVLQESIQVEGDRNFRGLLTAIGAICKATTLPVIVKEVGAGIDPLTAKRLQEVGVSAIDVGGRGGTSWGFIEGLRSHDKSTQQLAHSFRDWGIPTAYALQGLRRSQIALPLIATGGIRDGLMVAKAVALGARFVGIGLPLLRAALDSEEALAQTLSTFARGLRTTMLLTGSATLSDLSKHVHAHISGSPEADLS